MIFLVQILPYAFDLFGSSSILKENDISIIKVTYKQPTICFTCV